LTDTRNRFGERRSMAWDRRRKNCR